jgi:hypothetical protein
MRGNLYNSSAKERGNFGDLQKDIINMMSREIQCGNFEILSVCSGNELSFSVPRRNVLNT